jgi:hypothetical protein
MVNNQLLLVGVRVYIECLRHLFGRIQDARCKRRHQSPSDGFKPAL